MKRSAIGQSAAEECFGRDEQDDRRLQNLDDVLGDVLRVKASTGMPPRVSTANSSAAKMTPTGWFRPSSATAIPVKP